SGSGFVGRHGDDFALANNAQWVGFSVEIGPDGAIYVLDWHDADICGKEVLNKETGRVFRIAPTNSAAVDFPNRFADLQTLSDVRLVGLQWVESSWHARRARVILQHRAHLSQIDPDAVALLKERLRTETTSEHRLRALWSLHVIQQLSTAELTGLLDDGDEYVRAWAIQLLCEDRKASDECLDRFVHMAAADSSPVVRLYLASAMQRVPQSTMAALAERLTKRAEDADDHNIPRMIWFALEPYVTQHPHQGLSIAATSQMPLVTRHIGRRLADAGDFAALFQHLIAESKGRRDLLLGIRDAVDGRFDMSAPGGWDKVVQALSTADAEDLALVTSLSQQFGDTVASQLMVETLRNDHANLTDRMQAIRGLAGRQRPELRSLIRPLFEDPDLRVEVIRAVAAFDDDALGKFLLEKYPALNDAEQLEIVHTLSARPGYGRLLTQAIRTKVVPRRDIPAYVARLLQRVVGNGFLEVWGALDEVSGDQELQFTRYRSLLAADSLSSADPVAGRQIFRRTCAACHRLFGEGGVIGPDITGANRSSLEYLLGNILTPSAIIQDAYRMQIVLTDDGRVFSGIPASENDRQLRLRVAGVEEPIVIAKSRIESREVAPVSMMPEGILSTLSDQEVRNLVAYLQQQTQVPLSE
ncbi:MAG: c-type cytochrome, partial [Planctomycetaceae bacterium]|nr:c-type cytochrome [Planctomycetaceae bacterium]